MDTFIGREFYHYFREDPIKLVDVGASGGLKDNWKSAKRFLRVIAFEPDEKEFKRLVKGTSPTMRYLNTALHRERTICDFYITRKAEVSSIFQPNRFFLDRFPDAERFDILKTVKLGSDTLDNQLQNEGVEDIDFIKLDTQGSELFILEGARESLYEVFGLEIEVEFYSIYEGQPLFHDIDRFVRGMGFQLMDLKPCYWKRAIGKEYGRPKGQLIFADALYFRDTQLFIDNLNSLRNDRSIKSKVLRAISVCILYGYLDYALEILESKRRLFDRKEVLSFDAFLKRNVPLSSRLPNFRGRSRIAELFGALYRRLKPRHWATTWSSLGNL